MLESWRHLVDTGGLYTHHRTLAVSFVLLDQHYALKQINRIRWYTETSLS